MKTGFSLLMTICLLNTQVLFASQSELNLQVIAQKIASNIENLEEHPGLLADMQNALQPHSDIFNAIAQMPTNPEFEPYIKRYEELKAQYTGIHTPVTTKILLTSSPLLLNEEDYNGSDYAGLIQGSGVCQKHLNLIMIDRVMWEYYRDNDAVRQLLLTHELGHCDLNQDHIHNTIMELSFPEGFFCKDTRDWDPLYKDFFSMQNTRPRRKEIIFEKDNNPEGYMDGAYDDQKGVIYREKNSFLMGFNELFPTINKCLSISSTPCTNLHEVLERSKKEAMEKGYEQQQINPSNCS